MRGFSSWKNWTIAGFAFFLTVSILSVSYAGFVSGFPSLASSSTTLSSTEWNKMSAALQSLDSVFTINSANVGIGNPSPSQKLSVAGVIESTTGGFKFPDGSTQTKASYLKTSSSTTSTPVATSGWTDSGLSFSVTVDGKQSVFLMMSLGFTSNVAGRWLSVRFMRDSTQVGTFTPQNISEMANAPDTISFSTHEVDVLPPAGTYTYKIQWYAPSATVTAYGRKLTGLILADK